MSMGQSKNVRPDPHKHFVLGRCCPGCEADAHEHDGHVNAYLHEPDDFDKGKRRLMVFKSISDAKEYISETFDGEDAEEITIMPLSEATFGDSDWGDSNG